MVFNTSSNLLLHLSFGSKLQEGVFRSVMPLPQNVALLMKLVI